MPIFACDEKPLYLDHLGREIYADFEGKGSLREWKQLLQNVDSPGIRNGLFSDYCLVFNPPKTIRSVVINDCFDKIEDQTVFKENRIKGSGVLTEIESTGITEIWIDDNKCNFGRLIGNQKNLRFQFHSSLNVVGAEKVTLANYSEKTWASTDTIDVCCDKSRQIHNLKVQNESDVYELNSQFDQESASGKHRSHLNRMSFTLFLSKQNNGIVIRKTYDRFHGRQRARVLAERKEVGYWYLPKEDRNVRWAQSDFVIPKVFTKNKAQIVITIDPTAGSPLWNVSCYEVFCLPSK